MPGKFSISKGLKGSIFNGEKPGINHFLIVNLIGGIQSTELDTSLVMSKYKNVNLAKQYRGITNP